MSFILDALKKSETDRQRQNGPALFEVKVAPPRTGLPLWAVGLGVLLAVNLVIVAWVLLRRPAQAETNATQGQTAQAATDRRGTSQDGSGAWQGGQTGGGAWRGQPGQGGGQGWQGGQPGQQGGGWQGGGNPGQQQGGQTWQSGGQQPGQQGWQGGQPGQPGQNWQAGAPGQAGWQSGGQTGQGAQGWGGQPGYPGGAPQGQQGQAMAPVSGTAPTGPMGQAAGPTAPGFNGPAGGPGDAGTNADDYAPAAEPAPAAPFGNHVQKGTVNGVPLYQDAALQSGTHIPELRLDLHVFAAQPQDRFVMINMHKLHEGDSLPEGVRVESITPEGAVLSKDGARFLLPRQ
jgi:hypothetical protein